MLHIYINQVEYDTQRGLKITDRLSNKTESQISVLTEGLPIPVSGDIVEVRDDDEVIFWGVCGIPRSPKYQTGRERKLYAITCGNANAILGRRIINVAYQGYTVSQVVERLFNLYVSAEGITLGQISDIPITIEKYTGSNYNLMTALNELAELVGAIWQVTPDRRFYFLKLDDLPRFPLEISLDFLLGTDLQHTTKDYKVRTVQYISGATDTTSPQTEEFTYDGDQKNFITSFPLILAPTIYVNDVQVDPAYVGVNGLDDDSEGIQFAFSYNSQTISYKGDMLTAADVIKVVYTGQYPVRIAAYNDVKIAEIAQLTGTSGMIEDVYIASGVKTAADATQLAQSFIDQFNEVTGEVKFWLLAEHLEAAGLSLADVAVLTVLPFDLPTLGITGEYVITERTIEMLGSDDESAPLKVWITAANRDYLRAYGQTIAAIKRNIANLAIRGEDTVVQTANTTERVTVREETDVGVNIPAYCAAGITHGCLAIPQGLDGMIYPTEYGLLSGGAVGPTMYPCEELVNGSLFAPTDLNAEVYPV